LIKEYFLNYESMNSDFTINLKDKNKLIYHNSHTEDWEVTLAETGLDTNTGGRIKKIEKYIKEDCFFATYGDGVADINILELLKFHLKKGKIATLTGLHPMSRFGVIETGKDGIVTRFREKPLLDGMVNGGFFVFNRKIFNYLDENSILEREPMERLAHDRQLVVYEHRGYWQCMDTLRDAKLLNDQWNSGKAPWKIWE